MVGEPVVGARWSAARRFAGYGAASTLSLYLLVKVIWVVAALFGHGAGETDLGTGEWVILNLATVGMAVVGIVLALALAQPWGRRIPAAPLVFAAWVGAGFLIPLIPFMLLSAILGGSGNGGTGGTGGGDTMPAWERIFISIGFAGMAVGLVIALPISMRERFPYAFLGRLGDSRSRPPRNPPAVRTAMAVSCALGVLWLSWAFGATFALDPAHRDLLDRNARLLLADWGAGALAAAWSVHLITRRRATRLLRWIPTAVAFATSGSLFAWNSWKLTMAVLSPGDYATAEYPVVAVVEYVLAIGGGVTLKAALLRAQRLGPPTP
jgi:hypothetical protein